MANYCLDSNVIIDFLRDNENVSRHIAEARAAGNLLSICPIVYYEIVRGFKIANASKQLEKFMSLYQTLSNLPFDMKAAEKAVDIYAQLRKGQNIEDNDIYIAAISMINGCTLVTANKKHFWRVEGLDFVNWRDYD